MIIINEYERMNESNNKGMTHFLTTLVFTDGSINVIIADGFILYDPNEFRN